MSRSQAIESFSLLEADVTTEQKRERLRELAVVLAREAPTAEMRTLARLRSLELGTRKP